MKKKISVKKILLIILGCVLALLLAGWWALSVVIYDQNINRRFESYEPYTLRLEDFEGLERTAYEFPSDKGQMLKGYLYSAGEGQRGIIVIAHGFGGGGHNSYMDCADYFARHGYYVFAYDATGNDESEGDGVGGFPQGAVDLDYALTFVEQSGKFPALPIGLFGHSWGGYSVCSVLTYHPEVKAVIECAGCNASSDLFEAGGKHEAGDLIYTMMPFVKLHELVKYGKYASNTAMDGFNNSDADVMIVHSADDDVVPIEYGLDRFQEKYKDDPRFTFLRFEDRGHNHIFNDNTYTDEFNAAFDKWCETLDYDYQASENKERFAKDKADYIHQHLDRDRWSHRLDEELFGQFLAFYDKNVR
ncbi:MAG: alpha/beta fold hydrolase [Clostridia bacterium]|nr:alpha/beta fold hydrolase [Clostridia bacterium]